jgi:sec-independent protein translocase protein TatB
MFDIGFSEVLLIFVIALIVLGPEKLPKLASQVGRWVGRARAMARQFREQLEEEVNLENVRKAHKEAEARAKEAGASGGGTTDANAGVGSAATEPAGATGGANADAGAGGSASAAGESPGGGVSTGGGPVSDSGVSTGGGAAAGGASGVSTGGDAAAGDAGAGMSGTGRAGTSQGGVGTQAMPGGLTSPDPVDFRADTFSHAHPTNEFGANPYTSNGAAEPPPAAQPTESPVPDKVPAEREPAVAGAGTAPETHGHS